MEGCADLGGFALETGSTFYALGPLGDVMDLSQLVEPSLRDLVTLDPSNLSLKWACSPPKVPKLNQMGTSPTEPPSLTVVLVFGQVSSFPLSLVGEQGGGPMGFSESLPSRGSMPFVEACVRGSVLPSCKGSPIEVVGVGVERLRKDCVVAGMGQDGRASTPIPRGANSTGKAIASSVLPSVGNGSGERRKSCLDSSGTMVDAVGAVDARMKKMVEFRDAVVQ